MPLVAGDDPSQVALAEEGRMAAQASAVRMPQVHWHCERERKKTQKSIYAGAADTARVNAILKRARQAKVRADESRYLSLRAKAVLRRKQAASVKRIRFLAKWKA